jgi:hypothetical protein
LLQGERISIGIDCRAPQRDAQAGVGVERIPLNGNASGQTITESTEGIVGSKGIRLYPNAGPDIIVNAVPLKDYLALSGHIYTALKAAPATIKRNRIPLTGACTADPPVSPEKLYPCVTVGNGSCAGDISAYEIALNHGASANGLYPIPPTGNEVSGNCCTSAPIRYAEGDWACTQGPCIDRGIAGGIGADVIPVTVHRIM